MLVKIDKKAQGQELSDADVIQVIQKKIKELSEQAENYTKAGNNNEANNVIKQKELIEKYLPKMMSEEEIKNIILSLEDKSIPNVMKHFKANYNGQCDMQLVSKITREL